MKKKQQTKNFKEKNNQKGKFLSLPNLKKIVDTGAITLTTGYLFLIPPIYIKNLLNKIGNIEKSIFNLPNPYYSLIPISFLLLTFLYFSIHQYNKAKNLRIENQNKIAIIHGYQAIRTDQSEGITKTRFYDKVADIVFTKAFKNKKKDIGLPIDQVTQLATELAKVMVKK